VIILNFFLPINTPVLVKVEPGSLCQNEREEKQDENTRWYLLAAIHPYPLPPLVIEVLSGL